MVPTWHHSAVLQVYDDKVAPVPDFKIVCMPKQMIVLDLFNQSRLIQLLRRRWGLFYAPLVMSSLSNEKRKMADQAV